MDHCNKIKVPDPVLKDLISRNEGPNTIKKQSKADYTVAKLIYILKTNISKDMAFLLQSLTKNDSKCKKRYNLKIRGIQYDTVI